MMEERITLAVVINRRYGGFGLSFKAQEEIAKRKGLDYRVEDASHSGQYVVYGDWKLIGELPRTDPDLVAVVRELGAEANGESADLRVVEIGIEVEVTSYDGMERVRVHGGEY